MTKKRLLIVDDELMLLYSLRRILGDTYDVTIAHGGQKALDIINAQDEKFDLILSDVSMPDINGVNVYLYIKKHYPGLEKNVVFMTGGPMSEYLDEFLVSNKAICMTKPFEPDKLLATLNDIITSNSTQV